MIRFLMPLGVFIALALTLGLGLRHAATAGDPTALPSPLVGRELPAFDVPVLTSVNAGAPRFQPGQLKGKVWLLNIWASWCTTCLREHPVMLSQVRSSGVPLVGFNFQDEPAKARDWLTQHGNPYQVSFEDPSGRLGMDLGVIAVPETFVIDKQGRIRHKITGEITAKSWRETVLPLIRKLQDA
jgi:cytochrome c biogenesis protein CcmG/thiol:disulfide interchange protein DsbE